jgi:DNA-binding NtrC family response regulator
LGHGEEIDTDAVALPSAKPAAAVSANDVDAGGARAGLVGRTVADVERDLILETLQHCLGNRTHAANILGISIRTLRNKLQQYRQEGVAVPLPSEAERVPA